MKYHIKRFQLPLTGVWVWGIFQSRTSRKPFALRIRLESIRIIAEDAWKGWR